MGCGFEAVLLLNKRSKRLDLPSEPSDVRNMHERLVRLEVMREGDVVNFGAARVRVVVSGHSHQPVMADRHGTLYVNPGSAGPRRFRLPITVAELIVDGDAVTGRIQELAC